MVWLLCNEAQQIGCHKDKKIVCWCIVCRTQASSHNLQGIDHDRINEVGVTTAAPCRNEYSAVEWTRAKVAVHNFVAPEPQPKPPPECDI